jgi:hypothetical protein
MLYTLHGVNYTTLKSNWQEISKFFSLIKQDKFTMDDVLMLALARRVQVWVVKKKGVDIAALLTEIVDYPQKRVVRIIFGAGKEADNWMHLIRDVVIPWGKSQGCRAIQIDGRPGWKRVIRRHFPAGWDKPKSIVFEGDFE